MAGNKQALAKANTAVDKFSESFQGYLEGLGLPSSGVLVESSERLKVIENAPDLVELIDQGRRTDALYVSKFIAACGAGLFDAALNFIWDEVVVSLRERVARFDLSYFYDTAVPPTSRSDYSTEDDLRTLSDAALIKGALKCGMLTDIGYRHLDYIRDMRNWASAAHPNQATLTGFQLVSWFETCLKEVILKEPDGDVLEVGRLLHNLRNETISPNDVGPIAASVNRLPPELAASLLRAMAGTYCDPNIDVRVRDNLKVVAACVWNAATGNAKGEVSLKYANFAANGDVTRKNLAHEFLDIVGGLSHLPEDNLALEIQARITRLESAQDGMNNFYNEPPIARELEKYVPSNGRIPNQINDEYVRVLMRCRIGRPSGVALNAQPTYDRLIDLFDEPQLKAFVDAVATPEIASRLSYSVCEREFRLVLARLQPKAVSQPLKRVLAALSQASSQQLPVLHKDAKYAQLVAAL